MTHVEILDAARDRAGYKVDVTRGEQIGRVSSEWFSKPADERYMSLSDLYAAVHGRTDPDHVARRPLASRNHQASNQTRTFVMAG